MCTYKCDILNHLFKISNLYVMYECKVPLNVNKFYSSSSKLQFTGTGCWATKYIENPAFSLSK